MSKRGFTCRDCQGYAPADGQGRPMWPGPRCTQCAAKRYAAQTGCDPAQAELLMLTERSQNRADPRSSSAPALHETAAGYATQPPLMSVPYPAPVAPAALPLRERPVYRVANHSDACSLIELLTVLIGGPARERAPRRCWPTMARRCRSPMHRWLSCPALCRV